MTLATCLCISVGSVLGANARYWLSVWVAAHWGVAFPSGTLLINVSGSFVLCLLTGIWSKGVWLMAPELRLAMTVGFLGAYTTFSTFSLEWLILMHQGYWLRGLGYLLGSVLGGGMAGWLGLLLGRALAG